MSYLFSFVSEDLSHAIGMTIIHSFWQASLIALIMSFYLKKYTDDPSIVRYRVSLAALTFVILGSVVTFLYYFSQYSSVEALAGSEEFIRTVVSTEGILSSTVNSMLSWAEYLTQNTYLIAGFWLIGFLLFSVKFGGSYYYTRYLASTANDDSPEGVSTLFNRLLEQTTYTGEIIVKTSAHIAAPVMLGFVKPMILLPIGIVNQLTNSEMEAILAHELAHIVRNDFIHNILQSLIEIIYYYHPAVWWISANVRHERENCCDEYAIKLCGNAIDYAKTLVKIETLQQHSYVPQLAIPFSKNPGSLMLRIKRILKQPHTKVHLREKVVATALLFSTFIVFAHVNDYGEYDDQDYASHEEYEMGEQVAHQVELAHEAELAHEEEMAHQAELTREEEMLIRVSAIDDYDVDIEGDEADQVFVIRSNSPSGGDRVEERIIFTKNCNGNNSNVSRNQFVISDAPVNINIARHFAVKSDTIHPKMFWFDLDRDGEWADRFAEKFAHTFDKEKMAKLEEMLSNLEGKMNHIEFNFDTLMNKNYNFEFKFDSLLNSQDFTELFDHERYNEAMGEYNEKIQELVDKMEFGSGFDWRGAYHLESETASDRILQELEKDGLVQPNQDYEIELSGESLKINGKKQDRKISEKYRSLYEEKLGHELSKSSKISMKLSTKSKTKTKKI